MKGMLHPLYATKWFNSFQYVLTYKYYLHTADDKTDESPKNLKFPSIYGRKNI